METTKTIEKNELFEFVALTITLMDIVYFVVLYMTSARPWLSVGIAMLFPAINVPSLKLSNKTGKPFISYTLAFTLIPMFFLAWVSGPGSPAWLMCFSAIIASHIMTHDKRMKLPLIIGFILMAMLGSLMAGVGLIKLSIIFVTLLAYASVLTRVFSFQTLQNDKLAQEVIERQKAQKQMLQIIDFLPDPTFVIDNAGSVIAWNRAIEDLTGKKANSILGKGNYEYALAFYGERKKVLIDFVRLGEWDRESNEDYSFITEEDGIFVAESYNPDLKGGIYLSSTACVLLDPAGKQAGAIASVRDITARKLSEKELKQRLDDLTEARLAMLNIMEDIEAARKTTKEALEVISSSISYASHIQKAILPDNRLFSDAFSDYFIQWEPRDVVGGDIYWSVPRQNGLLLALGDCTGHGVPGAFMTLITTDALNRAESEMNELNLAQLVQRMHQIVQESLGQNEKGGTSDDGIELGVCYFNAEMTELIYVGARFSLFLVDSGEIIEIKGDKKAVGYRGIPRDTEYTEKRIKLQPGQKFYMTSDGLLDQIGGEKRRSFGKKRFKKLMVSLADVSFNEHGTHIYKALIEYQGKESRRDDVAVFGFKI